LPEAADPIEHNHIFVGVTVMLEVEWVRRSVYGCSSSQGVAALSAFCGLPWVTVEDGAAVANALEWTRRGFDFADALHRARAKDCEALISFDRGFAKIANTLGAIMVRVP
jgi:predicted nucleic-acid-binding protein